MMGGMIERKTLLATPARLARRLLPFPSRGSQGLPDTLPAFTVAADAITCLPDPAAFRQTLLRMIAQATRRIVIVTLYLQDDDAGREVLEALYAAKARRPELQVAVLVDWHRAQRGLIGKHKSEGNAGMYRAFAKRCGALQRRQHQRRLPGATRALSARSLPSAAPRRPGRYDGRFRAALLAGERRGAPAGYRGGADHAQPAAGDPHPAPATAASALCGAA